MYIEFFGFPEEYVVLLLDIYHEYCRLLLKKKKLIREDDQFHHHQQNVQSSLLSNHSKHNIIRLKSMFWISTYTNMRRDINGKRDYNPSC